MNRDEFRTMFVPASRVAECRAMADNFPGGVGMFITPFRDKTTGELTHYLSSGLIDATIAEVMPWWDRQVEPPVYHEGNVELLADMTGAMPEYITELCAECDISNQEWQDSAERLGVELEV